MTEEEMDSGITQYLQLSKKFQELPGAPRTEIPPELADKFLKKFDAIIESYQDQKVDFKVILGMVATFYKKGLKDRNMPLTFIATYDLVTLLKLMEMCYGDELKIKRYKEKKTE